jgi:hypothetical protein
MPLTETLSEIISFTDSLGHACSAFNTADSELIFIDCINSLEGGGPYNEGYIVNIAEGGYVNPSTCLIAGGG